LIFLKKGKFLSLSHLQARRLWLYLLLIWNEKYLHFLFGKNLEDLWVV
jgi:hypothetical protein